MDYKCKKVSLYTPKRIMDTTEIIYRCGKEMAKHDDLHHWDNSRLKTLAIVVYGLFKAKTFLVYEEKCIATFSVKKQGDVLHFGKLATKPECSGKGVGSWCLNKIEQTAKDLGCSKVAMEVYDKSHHALQFYLKRGYALCGEVKTRKYKEHKMMKIL